MTTDSRPQEARERTPQDYAIEHAEYMACRAEASIEAISAQDAITSRMDDGGYATQAEFDVDADALDAASEAVTDALQSLRSSIYEFRKRRDRALDSTPPPAARLSEGDVIATIIRDCAELDYAPMDDEYAGMLVMSPEDLRVILDRNLCAEPQELNDVARKLWETIKILGLSNDKLALQAIKSTLSTRSPVQEAEAEVRRLRGLAATCYAGLGAECNLPEKWLDALSAAANGAPFDTEGLLPFTLAASPVPSREERMVVLDRDAKGKPTIWCDPEIADIVAALNTHGLRTEASCSGHGHIAGIVMLSDGREVLIATTEQREKMLKVFGVDINGDPVPMASSAGEPETIAHIEAHTEQIKAVHERMKEHIANESLDTYDAGLLSDFGGGNVEWWQDYIRAELDRAHDFYQSQAIAPPAASLREQGDAARLEWLRQTLEWDGQAYWLKEICFKEREYGQEITPEPTAEEFREVIDAQRLGREKDGAA